MIQSLEAVERRARLLTPNTDPAHDFSHVLRVKALAEQILDKEQGQATVVIAAALLHELFNHPKDHPQSHLSGDLCAEHAEQVLQELSWNTEDIDKVSLCIRDHSFSKGVKPSSQEAKILQDADRLDALGAVGIMRWAATCSTMKKTFYSPNDPFCQSREANDKQWGVDHFYRKLLKLPQSFHTETARRLARGRVAFMEQFLTQLSREISDQSSEL